jgi:hypothetical protein
MADASDANMVGKLFFNIVQIKCFVLVSWFFFWFVKYLLVQVVICGLKIPSFVFIETRKILHFVFMVVSHKALKIANGISTKLIEIFIILS